MATRKKEVEIQICQTCKGAKEIAYKDKFGIVVNAMLCLSRARQSGSNKRGEVMPTAVANVQICKFCGHEFGTDEAINCQQCHSYLCPECFKCNCFVGLYTAFEKINPAFQGAMN